MGHGASISAAWPVSPLSLSTSERGPASPAPLSRRSAPASFSTCSQRSCLSTSTLGGRYIGKVFFPTSLSISTISFLARTSICGTHGRRLLVLVTESTYLVVGILCLQGLCTPPSPDRSRACHGDVTSQYPQSSVQHGTTSPATSSHLLACSGRADIEPWYGSTFASFISSIASVWHAAFDREETVIQIARHLRVLLLLSSR